MYTERRKQQTKFRKVFGYPKQLMRIFFVRLVVYGL